MLRRPILVMLPILFGNPADAGAQPAQRIAAVARCLNALRDHYPAPD